MEKSRLLFTDFQFHACRGFPKPIYVIFQYIQPLYLQNQLTNFLFPLFEKFPMTDHQNIDAPAPNPPQTLNGASSKPDNRPPEAKYQIQGNNSFDSVTNRKKNNVINLDSSSERHPSREAPSARPSEHQSSAYSKSLKPKKTSFKCQICKGAGRKSEMKTCSGCKSFCHTLCLDEHETKKKYVCDKCKAAHTEQSKATKKMRKMEQKIQTEKAVQKRLDKEKKKDDSNKTLEKFKAKYPYYVGEGDKIKFPIEDKLIFIYRDYFEPTEAKPLPTDHPIIPSKYLGDFMEIQNFIVSFGREFQDDYSGEYRKSVLYMLMNCNGSDKTFERLLGAIIKIYLKDIFEKNKTENVKILNDHCFFILLGTINESKEMTADYVAMVAAEIIRHLSNVPSMKNAFTNFVFPEVLNLESKLKTLISLIQGLSQVDGFHEMVGRKSEKIAEMTKDKADYVTKLKKNEAQALSNKEKLKEIRAAEKNDIEQQPAQVASSEKSVKQVEKNKKKSQKMATDGEHSDRIIKEFKARIVKIARMIPFAISEIMFLGNDRNKSSHYFYLREPNRVYVRYRNYFMDPNEDFKIFEGKEKIVELMKSLNTKGIHEKHLSESLSFLIKEDILRNLTLEEQMKECGTNISEPMDECVMMEEESRFRDKIISDVMDIEEKFSNYLVIKSCRWATDSKRQQFRFGFPYIDNVQAMKQAVRNLQESFLFVQVVREQVRADEQSDSNNPNNNEQNNGSMIPEKQFSRRKKPIRIWGINSEKIKKFWMEYLETCINYTGVWISVFIFRKYVEKYLDKKMEYIKEQQRREMMEKEKEERDRQLREQREREKEQRNLDRLRSRNKARLQMRKRASSNEAIEVSNSEGMRTRRRLRASTRLRHKTLTIDSDEEDEQAMQRSQMDEEDSDNEDECAVCGEVGDMICCDTCPKVFHLECLKIKEIPEGDWSCYECLQRLANERQTRSKARRITK